ncbi:hypothetical protein RYX36_003837, partial [Vicia faba]
MNAFCTGQQKRRKIQHHGSAEDHVRWHKTGKTKAVIEDGVHKGYKKILVLYIRSEKESKSYKSNWKMHQTMNAFCTGQQKRRKIQHHGSAEDHVRWHKTGKTKAVIEDG